MSVNEVSSLGTKMRFLHLVPQSLASSLCFLIPLVGSKLPFYFPVELHTETVTPPYHFLIPINHFHSVFFHISRLLILTCLLHVKKLFLLVGLALFMPFISSLKPTNTIFDMRNLSVNRQFQELLHLTLKNRHPEVNHQHNHMLTADTSKLNSCFQQHQWKYQNLHKEGLNKHAFHHQHLIFKQFANQSATAANRVSKEKKKSPGHIKRCELDNFICIKVLNQTPRKVN